MKRNSVLVGVLALVLSSIAALQTSNTASAALTFTVNQTADLPDAALNDNRCDTSLLQSDDQCSLRAAIQQANATPGTETITFVSSATHGLTRSGSDDDTANKGDLDITSSILIVGHSPNTTIDAQGIDRVFDIRAGSVTMKNLVVRGGHTLDFGGGIRVASGASLSLDNVVVRDNFGSDNTGGIESSGTLDLNHVSVEFNSSADTVGGLRTFGKVTIQNSTIANNFIPPSSSSEDAALLGTGSVFNSTITNLVTKGSHTLGNDTLSSLAICDFNFGCGIANTTTLLNTIVQRCLGSFNSLGYNLIQNAASCTINGNLAGNQLNVDPKLGALQNNGGLTKTRALLTGSPAIDAGNGGGCQGLNGAILTTDQRGFTRPLDGDSNGSLSCDMGAFEFVPVGVGSVSPDHGSSRADELVTFTVTWTNPIRWRDLDHLELRFRNGDDIPLWVRFQEGATSTFSLLDKKGRVVNSGAPGQNARFKINDGALYLAQSSFKTFPNDIRTVAVNFAVSLKQFKIVHDFDIEVIATDDFGQQIGPQLVGHWNVRP